MAENVGFELVLAISIGGTEDSYQVGGLIGYTISELTRSLQVLANQFASGVSFAGTTP